jgi:prophage regulatory protein
MEQQTSKARMVFIRQPEVLKRTALSRSTLYELIDKGQFPKPLKLGERINCWPEHEVFAWMESRIAAREGLGGSC